MERLLRFLIYTTYPFLAISILFVVSGLGFGVAFIAQFTIENRTGETISVTPVGTVGREGRKAPLPVTMFSIANLPALQRGPFPLTPGTAVTINYDMDDINFSEIVVENGQARMLQIVTDPYSTTNQYHGPRQTRYVIDDLADLSDVTPEVGEAAKSAMKVASAVRIFYAVMFGSWFAYGILRFALRRWTKEAVSSKNALSTSANSP